MTMFIFHSVVAMVSLQVRAETRSTGEGFR